MNANGAGRGGRGRGGPAGPGGRGRGGLGAGRGRGRGGLKGAPGVLRPAILAAINEAVKNAHGPACSNAAPNQNTKNVSDSINDLITNTVHQFNNQLIPTETDAAGNLSLNRSIHSLLKTMNIDATGAKVVVTQEESPDGEDDEDGDDNEDEADEAAETPQEEAEEEGDDEDE